MHHLRAILVYLLCALLLGSGVVARTAGSCNPSGGDCAPQSCCCSMNAVTAACPCKKPEPPPAPRAPAPKLLQEFALAAAEPRTDQVPATAAPKLRPATTVIVRTGALPRCSRQQALAVWRL